MFEYIFIFLSLFPSSPIDDFFAHKIFDKSLKNAHIILGLRTKEDNRSYYSINTLRSESNLVYTNNYPSISYIYNFGYTSSEQTMPILLFSNSYSSFCKKRIEFGDSNVEVLIQTLEEIAFLYQIYDLVDDTVRSEYNLFRKRQSLHKIKQIIGEEDFYSGKLPPFVPIWRFSKINED
jgi:hypothetical protein